MFWPFRTTGHTWFGMGSHQRWSPTRLKKVSYKQKTVFAHEKFSKNRHNSVSRPSPGMILGAKWIILHGGIFLNPQKSLGRPWGPKIAGVSGGPGGIWGVGGRAQPLNPPPLLAGSGVSETEDFCLEIEDSERNSSSGGLRDCRRPHPENVQYPPQYFYLQSPPSISGSNPPPLEGGPAVGEACGAPKPPLLTRGVSPPGPPDLHGDGTDLYMIWYMIIYGPYMIIYGPYMMLCGPYMIIYGPYMIIYGTYMIIFGPYMIMYGPYVVIYGPYTIIYSP